MDEKKKERSTYDEELDRFWNINALMPRRRPIPVSRGTDTVEVTVEAPPRSREDAVRAVPISPREATAAPEERTVIHSVAPVTEGYRPTHGYVNPASQSVQRATPEYEYVPESALIHSVRVYRWKSSYSYYEDFVRAAEKLQGVTGTPCQHVKFFSYVPQYAQMTRAQFGWYLWFRECVKQEFYPETDYSYILLYAYEIINLGDRLSPAQGQQLLLRLWVNYRNTYRQLDQYFPDWICDYSLIYRLPPPDTDRSLTAQLMSRCALKEFYVPGNTGNGYVQALLSFCSNYDYRKSKFCTEENRTLFDGVMLSVLRTVTEEMSANGKLFSATGMQDSTITRDAFSGALCSYRKKRKLEISYCSFSRSHELRFLITDLLKYTENLIRGALGVRSKLTVYALPVNVREIIDRVALPQLPKRQIQKKTTPEVMPEYEKLYDLPSKPLDTSHAAAIESASWDTTRRLVEAFEEDLPEEPALMEAPVAPSTPLSAGIAMPVPAGVGSGSELWEALTPYRAFLRAANAEEQEQAARALGKMPDAVADEVNGIAVDMLGDILLEAGDSGYEIPEDYLELLEGFL